MPDQANWRFCQKWGCSSIGQTTVGAEQLSSQAKFQRRVNKKKEGLNSCL
jgi:hypothetical protein